MNAATKLVRVMEAHGVTATERQTDLLAVYCRQLWDWNARLNLTRHTDFETFVTHDLHDSRQIADLLNPNARILDVGSGGGVPGIPIAILRPDVSVALSESTQKKATALQLIVEALSLDIPVYPERGEAVIRQQSFDTLTARAVAPLKKLIPLFRPCRRRFRRLLLIKGPGWHAERQEADSAGLLKGVTIRVAAEYATVGRDGKSVILEVMV